MKNLFNFMLLGLMILASCTSDDKTEEVAPLGKGPQTLQITLPLGGTNTKGFDDVLDGANASKPFVNDMTIYIANAQGVILKSMTVKNESGNWSIINGVDNDKIVLASNNPVATINLVPATAAQVYVLANGDYTGSPTTIADVKTKNPIRIYSQQDDKDLLMTGVDSGFTPKTVDGKQVWAVEVSIAPKVARFQIQEILKTTVDVNTEALASFKIKAIYVNQYYETYSLSTEKETGNLFARWSNFPTVTNPTPPSLNSGIDLIDDATLIDPVPDTRIEPATWGPNKCYAYQFFPGTGTDNSAKLPHIVIAIDNIKFTAAANMPELVSTDVRYLVIKKYRITSTSGDLLTSFEKGKLYNLTIPVAAKNLNLDPNAPTVTIECTVTVKPWTAVNIVPEFTN